MRLSNLTLIIIIILLLIFIWNTNEEVRSHDHLQKILNTFGLTTNKQNADDDLWKKDRDEIINANPVDR